MFCKYVLWLCLEFDEISVGGTVKMHYLSFIAPKMSSSHKFPHATGSSTWMRSSGSSRIGPRGHTPFHNLLVLGVSLPLEWCQHAVMHPQYGCTTSMCNIQHAQRKDEVHRLAHKRVSLHDALLEKTLKLRRSVAHLETNARDKWKNHSQPAKGPWSMLHQISTLYTGLAITTSSFCIPLYMPHTK